MSSGFRSAAMLREYFGDTLFHRPERSGLPSAVRGAGAVRLGFPSAVRGIPGVGTFSHCANAGVAVHPAMTKYETKAKRARTFIDPPRDLRVVVRFWMARAEVLYDIGCRVVAEVTRGAS